MRSPTRDARVLTTRFTRYLADEDIASHPVESLAAHAADADRVRPHPRVRVGPGARSPTSTGPGAPTAPS